jgi:hypothetical protein
MVHIVMALRKMTPGGYHCTRRPATAMGSGWKWASIGEIYHLYNPTHQLVGTSTPERQQTTIRYLTADQTQPYLQTFDAGGGNPANRDLHPRHPWRHCSVVRDGHRLTFNRDHQGKLIALHDDGTGDPFTGSRASGTSDKTGTVWKLIRLACPRLVKRNDTAITTWPTV